MIDLAYHFWDLNKTEESRKRKRDERAPEPLRLKNSGDQKPTDRAERFPPFRRGGYRERHRDNRRGGYRESKQGDRYQRNNSQPAQELPTRDSRNPTETGQNQITCYTCGKTGHYATIAQRTRTRNLLLSKAPGRETTARRNKPYAFVSSNSRDSNPFPRANHHTKRHRNPRRFRQRS